MNPRTANGSRNRILAGLPPAEYERLSPHLEDVELNYKETLYDQGESLDALHFVERGVISLVVVLDDDLIEAGTVGNEGVAGIHGILGVDVAPGRAICQVPGGAKRLDLSVAREQPVMSVFWQLLLRYTNALISMLAQTAACNRAHPLDERMCRWLLMTVDRVDRDEFPLTQEFLAQMLGVRRPSVNLAGATLQRAGLIRYSRGSIKVLDRKGLEESSCECYARIRDEFARAFDMTRPRRKATRQRQGT
jgi:CRP-like cAMP-binding protein